MRLPGLMAKAERCYLLALAPTSNTVVLSWASPAGADQPLSYSVQTRLSGAGTWSAVATDIAAPPFAVTGLQPSTQDDFQVFAVNAAGASLPSSAV
jgi:Fibronectin type III domain